ncbi:MAG: histidine kinase dimerization/phospho-acceptor domain-containing protein, partial [Rhodoplanes sp.]
MLATIAEMDSMVAATLRFARDDATAEPRRRTDLTALLASVVDDMADTELPVAMEPAQRSLIENRTRMLAAISHDLRTPLTLLRLRAESVEDGPIVRECQPAALKRALTNLLDNA